MTANEKGLPDIARPWVEGKVRLEGRAVEVDHWVETHTAVVIVGRDKAFKIRKPVDLGYVRHMTPELRSEAAERELALGLGISPHVYLGVWSIEALEGGELRDFQETGEPVLAMNRLPEELRADAIMGSGAGPDRLDPAVEGIARFHERQPVDMDPAGWGDPDRVRKNWLTEFDYLPEDDDNPLWTRKERDRLLSETAEWLDVLTPTLQERIARGKVREGHGDLRLEHLYLTDPFSVIDPLEFSVAYRFGDVAAEICFVAMELDEMGRFDGGSHVVRRYAALTKDKTLEKVSPFFRRYRAIIRAKVEWIRSGQTGGKLSEEHLERGRRLVRLASSYVL